MTGPVSDPRPATVISALPATPAAPTAPTPTAPLTAAATTPITTLDHAGIAQRIPHQGTMCLLARLVQWDAAHIVCTASSHRDPLNPLRCTSGLLSPCAIEYAAQAMALHGALCGQATGAATTTTTARPGFLASARGVQLHRLRLDDLPGDLQIEARRLAGDEQQILYQFSVNHAGQPIADGRATVVLNTPLAS